MVIRQKLSRRDFLKLSAGSTGALGLLLLGFPNFEQLLAAAVAEVPVIWIQGGGCSGCSVSVLNSLSPKIQDVLISEVVPGSHVGVRFHPTIMAASGEPAMRALDDTARQAGKYLLVVEGTVPTADGGVYCEFGERDGHGITLLEHVTTLGRDAMAVVAVGACATYGGIPAAAPNTTGSKGVGAVFQEWGIQTPVINLPGCPPHPDWFIGTVASILIGGLGSVEVDDLGRPGAFYGHLIHDNCQRRGHFDAGRFAKKFSDPYCLYELGCKGPVTHADCPIRLWNSGTSWCVGSNSPCIGCCEPGFPDDVSPLRDRAPLYAADIVSVSRPTPVLPEAPPPARGGLGWTGTALAGWGGLGAGLALGAAAVLWTFRRRMAREKEEQKDVEGEN